MFKFTAVFAIAAVATSVVAGGFNYNAAKCNTGEVQCCNSFQSAQNVDSKWLAGLFNVDVNQVTGQAGFKCNPITGIGKGDGSKCTTAPVCCDQVHQATLVGLNCSPVVGNA